MKKLITSIATLLMAAGLQAQTTTYTGTIRDLAGNPVTSGQVRFTLAPATDSTISGIGRFVPTTVICKINGDGTVAASGGGPCTVTQNTALSPGGTSYRICIQPQFATPGSCFYDYATSITKDISTVAPTLQTGPLNYNGVAGPPLNFLGAWSSTTTYQLGQVVSYSSGTYISLTAANLDNTPSTSPSMWSLVVTPGGVSTTPTTAQTISQPDGTALKINRACIGNNSINVKSCFNAKGDLGIVLGCSTSGNSVICGSAVFAATDVGKQVYVSAAGSAGSTFASTIAGFVNSRTITLSSSVTVSSTGPVMWGTDDTAALQAAFNLAATTNTALYIPAGAYMHHGLNWTGQDTLNVNNPPRIYGDAFHGSNLHAVAVTDSGRVNAGETVGVDISANSFNQIADLNFFGGTNVAGFADLAPTVNVFAGRSINSPSGGGALAVGHSFENVYSYTTGDYDFVLYGYEQADFHNDHFEMAGTNPKAALYLSAANTPGFVSPWITITSSASMTKVNISGANTEFAGQGNMIVLDQGTSQGVYTVSIRDAYASMGPATSGNCAFISDTGTYNPSTLGQSALRHIVLDTVYIETESSGACYAAKISGPAWNWRLDNVQKYSILGNTVPQFLFSGGFLDSVALVDSDGQVGGIDATHAELIARSCAGSVLHLGQAQPSTNCTDYLMAGGTGGGFSQNTISQFQNSGTSSGWWKLGTWMGANIGSGPMLIFSGGSGLNSNGNNQAIAILNMRISNDSTAPNLTGVSIANVLGNSGFTNVKAVATGGSTAANNKSWDIYLLENGNSPSNYSVDLPAGSIWTPANVAASDPGGASSTVVVGSVNALVSVPPGTTPFSGSKTAGTCALTILNGLITAVSGC